MKSENKKTFSRGALLKSKRFSHIQQDFLKAILTKDYYSIDEAEAAIKKALGGGK